MYIFQESIFTFISISGNDAIHFLTKTDQELRVDLTDSDGDKVYALYSTFKVGNETSKYQLTVSGYSGTAGMYASHFILTLPNQDKQL
jgi:ficolin